MYTKIGEAQVKTNQPQKYQKLLEKRKKSGFAVVQFMANKSKGRRLGFQLCQQNVMGHTACA